MFIHPVSVWTDSRACESPPLYFLMLLFIYSQGLKVPLGSPQPGSQVLSRNSLVPDLSFSSHPTSITEGRIQHQDTCVYIHDHTHARPPPWVCLRCIFMILQIILCVDHRNMAHFAFQKISHWDSFMANTVCLFNHCSWVLHSTLEPNKYEIVWITDPLPPCIIDGFPFLFLPHRPANSLSQTSSVSGENKGLHWFQPLHASFSFPECRE